MHDACIDSLPAEAVAASFTRQYLTGSGIPSDPGALLQLTLYGDLELCTYLTLTGSSSGLLQNNGQQTSPAYTVDCYHIHLIPADSSCLQVITLPGLVATQVTFFSKVGLR